MLEAIKDKVIVEVYKREHQGGLIIPDTVKVDPQSYGKVISIGEEVDNIEIGDILFFHPNGGMTTVLKDKIFRVLKYDEIYGKVVDKDTLDSMVPLKLGAVKNAITQLEKGSKIIHAQ